jgi:hypothetical protein
MILARRLEAMEHGLSARRGDSENISQTVSDSGSGRIQISAKSASDSGSDYPLDVTKPDTGPPHKKLSAFPRASESDDLRETQYTGEGSSDGGYSLVEAPRPAVPRGTGKVRFTTVEEEPESETSPLRETLSILVSPQTWLLIGSLACLALIAAYLLQPPSADKLFEAVVALANDENPERLLEAEDKIIRFLEYYPEDSRAAEIEGYRDDIELMKLERRFDRRVRQMKMDQFSAIERAYAEAMHVAAFDPQQATVQLQALLDLYGQDEAQSNTLPSDPRRVVVQLAEKKLPRLRKAVEELASEDLRLLKKQLAHADKLYTSEPAKARAMWEGIVVLYEKKSWSQDMVEQARRRLSMYAEKEPQTARTGS